MSNNKVTKLKPRSKPAAALDTPTDLDEAAVKAVSEALNGLLADSFRALSEDQEFPLARQRAAFPRLPPDAGRAGRRIFAATDDMAERVRKIGGTTLRSIGHIAKLQTIEDNDAEFVPPGEMLRELMNDNKKVAEDMRKAHEVGDDHDDPATASMIEIWLDQTEKRTWFLFEAARGASNDGH